MRPFARWFAASVLVGLALAAPAGASTADETAGDAPWRYAESASKVALANRFRLGMTDRNADAAAYDVGFYALDLEIDPTAALLIGTVTMRARAVQASCSSAGLDLDDSLQVDGVTAGVTAVAFTHSDDLLMVTLDRSYAAGESFELQVHYRGRPDPATRSFVFDTHAGQPLVWTLSEPYGARLWWPCKDTPADKADSVDVALTVPTGMIAVSEGVLRSTTSPTPDQVTFHWHERYPIATYLISVAAFAYTVQTVTYTPLAGGSMPVTVWSYPEEAGAARGAAELTVGVLQRFAGLFGEYPFVGEKYGYAQCNFGGGMEHQTATSAGNWSPGLAVHETAHQWFGDAITCGDFSDVWLNEGFATYAEALWDEGQGGLAAYRDNIWQNRYYGPGTIRVPDPENATPGRLFDVNLSYNKASWVLHMLRGVLGDPTFFEVLRAYAQDSRWAYGTATTADFQAVAETVSGRDLSRFFSQWIDAPYYPAYLQDFSSTQAGGGWNVRLDLEQLQPHLVYEMPIPVRISTAAGAETFTVFDSLPFQSFDLQVAAEPMAVQLDPDHWLLHTSEPVIHEPTFADGILLVNGVAWWSPFGAEVVSAYADSVFAGRLPFSFWDHFPPPAGGYVPELPEPIGHGIIPPEVFGRFSTVVWVGNIWADDLDGWNASPIASYLRQGGNVLLLGRRGQEFLGPARADYLGLRWAENPVATLGGATPAWVGLVPMAPTDVQTQCAVFETSFDRPETQLLFTDATYFDVPRGIAAWRHPAGGGSRRPSGGHFAFVSGRPYRWEHGALRSNLHTILNELFGEPLSSTPVAATLEATQESAGIHIAWHRADADHGGELSLQRDADGAPRRILATWSADATSGVWLDRDVRIGVRYRYQLVTSTPAGPIVLATREVQREAAVPIARARLRPVAPNPFNAGVVLEYELARAGRATLRIYDARGRIVRTLLEGRRPAGPGHCTWDGRDSAGSEAPSGTYLIRLDTEAGASTVKATLAR